MAKSINEKSPEQRLQELEKRVSKLEQNVQAANVIIGGNFRTLGERLEKLRQAVDDPRE